MCKRIKQSYWPEKFWGQNIKATLLKLIEMTESICASMEGYTYAKNVSCFIMTIYSGKEFTFDVLMIELRVLYHLVCLNIQSTPVPPENDITFLHTR